MTGAGAKRRTLRPALPGQALKREGWRRCVGFIKAVANV